MKGTHDCLTSDTQPLINGAGQGSAARRRREVQVDYFNSPHLSLKQATVWTDMPDDQLMDG